VTPRVLLDATAVPADRGGVGRYVDDLVGGLVRAGADLVVACQATDVARYEGLGARPHAGPASIARRPARLAWEQTGLPRVAAQVRADVLHSPHYTMPARAGRPVVVTLHDATFFSDPHVHSRGKGVFFRAATRHAVRRAARCIVPSAATRDELRRLLGTDGADIDVAHHGVDQAVFAVPDDDERARARAALGIGEQPYVAFLGTLEPRKNVPALVRGWIRACEGRTDPPALVLAGGAGWDEQIDGVVAQVPPHLRLVRPGYLPLEDLRGYLGGAEVVAYPSLGEGFGLPVLEAMACGAPVLTTRRLSLPEVGGDAVAYTEPDAESIGRDLGALLDDPARRTALGAAGQARATTFTWDRCAQQHLASYERALASTSS
jgi:glycosyltransferase involved in cell wall biosynthesis